jgi:uncharacterized protein YbaP (TraB family)
MRGKWIWIPIALAAALGGATAAAAAPAKAGTPRPPMWLLSDEDTKIYLFGTIHILPKGFQWRSPAFDAVVAEADELVIESVNGSKESMAETVRLIMLDTPRPLLQRVPARQRAALKKEVARSGLPAVTFDRMQTWAASLMLGLSSVMRDWHARGPQDIPGVEDWLEKEFKARGKPIRAIEDPASVVRNLNAVPEAAQVRLLGPCKEAVDDDSDARDERQWASGNIDALTVDAWPCVPPEMRDALVTRRNAAWTDWLAERLKKPGTVLVAVGGGHFAGRDSLLLMLQGRRLSAARVQ